MKLTKSKLKQLIKEELKTITEVGPHEGEYHEVWGQGYKPYKPKKEKDPHYAHWKEKRPEWAKDVPDEEAYAALGPEALEAAAVELEEATEKAIARLEASTRGDLRIARQAIEEGDVERAKMILTELRKELSTVLGSAHEWAEDF